MPKRLLIGGLLATSLLYTPLFSAEEAAVVESFNEKEALSLKHVDLHGDTIRWGGADGLQVVNLSGKSVVVSDGTHQLKISFDLLEKADAGLMAEAKALLKGIEQQDRDTTFTLAINPLVGAALRHEDVMYVEAGRLTQQKTADRNINALTALIRHQRADLITAIEKGSMSQHAQAAIVDMLKVLDQKGDDPSSDEVTPGYGRKVVADGFLTDIEGLGKEAKGLTAVVREAITFQPTTVYQGKNGLAFTIYQNAFDDQASTFTDGKTIRYLTPAALPAYHWPAQSTQSLGSAVVINEFPASVDPLHDHKAFDSLISSEMHHGNVLLAKWTKEEGFRSDMATWRSIVPATHRRLDENIVQNYLPPHIIVRDSARAIHYIITPHGTLRPAADGSSKEAQRFMEDASKVLPDAAHLDLISQYIFKYIYDSPDPTMPTLLGSREINSDIHQTAFETLSTTVGGICRGDCDDLSELGELIVEKQKKIGHVVSLPGHAALAWAENFDEQWHVFVLQTGPTLQFSAPRLQDALRATYQSFDASEAFDPNALGVLLRFSGENRRSPWRLSYRIFSDEVYSDTMINVQKDWHYQTYLQGINKMLKLIEQGDDDTANYRELAGLYSFTGQYDKAVEYHQLAIDRTKEDESLLLMNIEMLMHLHDAERDEEMVVLSNKIIDEQLPAMQEQLGQSILQVGLQLTSALGSYDQPQLAAKILRQTLGNRLAGTTQRVAQWSQTQFNAEAWMLNSQLRMVDRLLNWHGRSILPLIEANREGSIIHEVPDFNNNLQINDIYRRYIAFNSNDGADISAAYADQGHLMEANIGRDKLLELLAETELPEAPINHRIRTIADEELTQRDLSWIKASVPFWSGLITESLADIRTNALTKEQAMAILPQLTAAIEATDRLGLNSPRIDFQSHISRLIIAMITEDEKTLRELLTHVKKQQDKRLIDNTAMYMGDVAYAVSPEWFAKSMKVWEETVDHKAKYLWVAWRAALNEAPDKALIAAKASAERFPDDKAFQDEYQFMIKLLNPNL